VALGDDTDTEDAIIDKYSIVTKGHSVKGKEDNVLYVKQGAIL
jgi:hypothetical protein